MNTITLWQVASVPFWMASAWFITLGIREMTSAVRPRCVPCNLITAGLLAYIAARIAV